MRALVLSFVIAISSRAHAEPLSLARAQAEARAAAPSRVVADVVAAAARDRADAAGRRVHDPVASTRYQQAGTASDDRAWSFGLEWTLELTGAPRARQAAARASVDAADAERAAVLAELDATVALAHAELAGAQRRLARLSRMVELRELAVRVAERIRGSGSGTVLEVDAATLDLRATQIQVATARGDLAAAREQLAILIGRRDGSDLVATDELDTTPPGPFDEAVVDRDPRVRAVAAQLVEARRIADAERLAVRPPITIAVELGRARHDIPAGSFAAQPDLTGAWTEWELGFQLAIPLPVFDRNRLARATARGDVRIREARLAQVKAEVRLEYATARDRLLAALDAVKAAADIPPILDREVSLLDKALRASAIELEAWAQQARRLVEAGQTYDEAVLAVHRARAAWLRLTNK
ncbi:MAG TPA: TolC family protein [Kofleriaceae bacterium]|nr:TolC family protein [Kofleriaceae bacterium]